MNARAEEALRSLLGPEGFSLSEAKAPQVRLRPASLEEAAGVLELANRFGLSLSLARPEPGQAGLFLTCERLNRLLEIDPGDSLARVQAGLAPAKLAEAARAEGLFWPFWPADGPDSNLGRDLARGVGGLRGVKYGLIRDYSLGLKVVLGSGQIITTGGRSLKSVVGYDLTRLLVGSWGGLGLIVEATLKLLPRPETSLTLAGYFPGAAQAAASAAEALRAGLDPSALEIMDQTALDLAAGFLPQPPPRGGRALLLAEVDGPARAAARRADQLAELWRRSGTALGPVGPAEGRAFWAGLERLTEALGQPAGGLTEDVTVPPSRLPDLLSALERLAGETGLSLVKWGRAGEGLLRLGVLPDSPAEAEEAVRTLGRALEAALDLGGSLAGELRPGPAKAALLAGLGGPELDFTAQLKGLFDPNNVLRPGFLPAGEARSGPSSGIQGG